MSTHKRLGECLVKANVISQEQLEKALQIQRRRGGFLGRILLELGYVSDKELCRAVSEALHVNCVSIDSILISGDVLTLVPESLAATSRILPLFVHGKTLYLAMENPRDIGAIQLVEFSTGMKVKPLLVPQCQLHAMLRRCYDIEESLISDSEEKETYESSKVSSQTAPATGCEEIEKLQKTQTKRLGELLVDAGIITQDQLEEALKVQQASHAGLLGQILIKRGWVSEQEICQIMADSLHMDYIHDDGIEIAPDVVELVPESLAASCNVFPLNVKHNVLYLAMENPLDIGVIQLVEFSTGMKVEPLIAGSKQLERMIRQHYNATPSASDESQTPL